MNNQGGLKATSSTSLPQRIVQTVSDSSSSASTPQLIPTPASTASLEHDLEENLLQPASSTAKMDEGQSTGGAVEGSQTTQTELTEQALEESKQKEEADSSAEPDGKKKKKKAKKTKKSKPEKKQPLKKKKKEKEKEKEASSSESASDSGDSDGDDESSSSSEDEKESRRRKKIKAKQKVKAKLNKEKEKEEVKKKKKLKKKSKMHKSRKDDSSSNDDTDSSESSSDSEPEDEKKKQKKKRKKKDKAKVKKKAKKQDSSSDEISSDSSSSSPSSSSSSSSDSSSDSEDEKKGKAAKKRKTKSKDKKKSKKRDSSSEESSSDSSSSSSSSESESESEDEKKKSRKKKAKKSHKSKRKGDGSSSLGDAEEKKEVVETTVSTTDVGTSGEVDIQARLEALTKELAVMQMQQQQLQLGIATAATATTTTTTTTTEASTTATTEAPKKGVLEYKRVDHIYDSKTKAWKLTETGEEEDDEFDCVFTVRRRFTWKNEFLNVVLDIKSHALRDALQVVLKNAKGVSLVEDTPCIYPNEVFLHYDELKMFIKKLKSKLKKTKKSKEKDRLRQQRDQCKLLAKYIDEDYRDTRKKLRPMLNAGSITFELVWALFKSGTIAYTPTYGNKDDPRAFRVDYTYFDKDLFGNEKLIIEGQYLEYDGKIFGLGDYAMAIPSFKGAKKIVNLEAYPLKYHKDSEGVRKQLIERGKKFIALQGMNYRAQSGMGYLKQRRGVSKVSVSGRVMVDPALFRRTQPNYPISYIKQDEVDQDESESEDSDQDSDGSSKQSKVATRLVVWKDEDGKKHMIRIPVDAVESGEKLDAVGGSDGVQHTFTEEELLIASPVVLGFAFSEKTWLELSLQGISEIEWNKEAFNSLVLAPKYKQNLKGLVSNHRLNAAKTVDDVIQGKGKGMVVVMHGPPGVGKTLTAESIAEYLRCPLYSVSAGELGTDSRTLERELNKIMEITHAWGAILLIDEADVYMEARQPQDVHRNSLVSVFLRLLEYYQGILFLTTNRVETFDEAFQSRIHLGLKYEHLTPSARLEIWKHHIDKVVTMEGQESQPFQDRDLEELSLKVLNGRQIKNAVKTAQSIALAEKEVFGIQHIKSVMEVQDDFVGGGRAALAHYV